MISFRISLFIIISIFFMCQISFAQDPECEKFLDAPGKVSQVSIQNPTGDSSSHGLHLKHFWDQKRGYIITLATWSGGMFLASQMGGDTLSFLLGCAVAILGSPILEQVTSKFRHIVFYYPQGRTQGQMESLFGKQWVQTQGTFSLNAQMSRNLHIEALQLIQNYLPPGLIVLLQENPELAQKLISDKLIELSQIFGEHLEDLPYDHPQISRAVFNAIVQHLEDRESWLQQMLQTEEPHLKPNEKILTFWLLQVGLTQ